MGAARGEFSFGASRVLVIVGAYSCAAGLGLVLPVLLFVPSLRLAPYWGAAVWGAAVAMLFCLLLLGLGRFPDTLAPILLLMSNGAAAGLTYALAARALMRLQQRG